MSGAPDPNTVDGTILKGSDLVIVMRATKSIAKWDVLSLLLGIDATEFQRLQQNALTLNRDLHMSIIQRWLDSGTASWSSLVEHLSDGLVGKVQLAQEIAKKHPRDSVLPPISVAGSSHPSANTSIEDILTKSPERNHAHKLLKDESDKWYEIGNALNVKRNFREELKKNPDSADTKLESVLNKWISSECSPVTWKNLISVLKDEDLAEVAREVKRFLDQDAVKKQYEQKLDWVPI